MSDRTEAERIFDAIDIGGGQACDVKGVIRKLLVKGYMIIPSSTKSQQPWYSLLRNLDDIR